MAASKDAIIVAERVRDMGVDINRKLMDAIQHPPNDVHNLEDVLLFLRLVTVLMTMSMAVQTLIDEHTEST